MCGHFSPVSPRRSEAHHKQAAASSLVSLNEDVCVQILLLVLRKSVLSIDSSVCWEAGQLDTEGCAWGKRELSLLTLLPCDQELLV